jgi:peptidoglycan/xylan/chitin deacetylase (PgdA/CDA1 family)
MPMPHALQILAGQAMRPLPLRPLERLVPRNLIGFCYHLVTDGPPAHVRHLFSSETPRQFERDLEFIGRNYVPLSYADLQAGPPFVQGQRPGAIVTFDDGLRECFSVVRPLLRKHGVPAVFFVTTDFLDNRRLFYRHKASLCIEAYLQASVSQQASTRKDLAEILNAPVSRTSDVVATLRSATFGAMNLLDAVCTSLGVDADAYLRDVRPYLSSTEVRSLAADGFTIGAHGRSHLLLASIAPSNAEADIVESCAQVADLVGQASVPYAFPFNGRGVSRALLRRIRDGHPQLGPFFDTQGLAEDSADVINRIVVDGWSRSRVVTALPIAIRLAYARELARSHRRRTAAAHERGD